MISPENISSRTRVLAIIGDPISHSISPRIQNAAWRAASEDCVLVACRVKHDDVIEAVRGAQKMGFLGLMVTVPHKLRVLDVCDQLDDSARDVGAANLLHFRDDGQIIGYSSDGWAAVKDLEEHDVAVRGARAAILGAGGAARSLALTLAREGVGELRIFNRTMQRAHALADEVRALGVKVTVATTDDEAYKAHLRDVDLLINATSVGMKPNVEETPLHRQWLRAEMAVYDIVYNPLETRLLREAREMGARGIDGLGMLIGTNIRAAQICAGIDLSWDVMRSEAMAALSLKS